MLQKKSTMDNPIEALYMPENNGWDVFNRSNIKIASIEKMKPVDLGGFDLQAAIENHPDQLFVKVFAIKADEINDNGDYFSKNELKKSAHTFIGVPVFVNHQNDDVEKSRGKVIYAWFDDDQNGIYTINMVDRKAYPKLARGIEEGYISNTSMGCAVGHSICSICHNKAVTAEHFCSHIANRKNRKFNGKHKCEYQKSDDKTDGKCPVCSCKKGEEKNIIHKDAQVFEYNYEINFIEDSFVVNPACHSCTVCDILSIPTIETKVAKIKSALSRISESYENNDKHCSFMKKVAGEKEIHSLNDAMNLLEGVTRSMMAQKQQVSLDYVSDIVDTLANLQNTSDELIEMGYGQLPSPSIDTIDSVSSSPPSPIEPNPQHIPQNNNFIPNISPNDMSDISSNGIDNGMGTITKPSFSANNTNSIEELYKAAMNTREDILRIGNQIESNKTSIQCRRKVVKDANSIATAISGPYKIVISSDESGETYISEFKGNDVLSVTSTDVVDDRFAEMITKTPKKAADIALHRLVYESSSDQRKSLNQRTAAGTGVSEDQTEMITEKQLSESSMTDYTSRWGSGFYEGITQSDMQLGKSEDVHNDTNTTSPQRRNGTYEFITEAQFNAVTDGCICRWDDFPETITEKQWTDFTRVCGAILPDDWSDSITQRQLISLRESHRWEDPNAITEDQLKSQDAALPIDNHTFRTKSASGLDYHKNLLVAATDTISDAISKYKLSPNDIVRVSNLIFKTPQSQLKTAYLTLLNSVPLKISEREDLVNRNNYHNNSNNTKPVDLVIASLGDHVRYFDSRDLLNAFQFVINDERAFKKAEQDAKQKLVFSNNREDETISSNMFKKAFENLEKSDDGTYKVCASIEDIGVGIKDKNFIKSAAKFAKDRTGIKDLIITNIDVNDKNSTFEVILKERSVLSEEEVNALKIADKTVGERLDDADEMTDPDDNYPEEEGVKKKQASRMERRKELIKQAQMMGGQMGGQGGVSQAPGAGATLPQPPGGVTGNPIESFDQGDPGMDDNFDLEGEDGELLPKPPGSTCPVCTSEDVDVIEGRSKCNNCQSEWTIKVNLEVTKWTDLTKNDESEDEVGEEGEEGKGFALEDEAPMDMGEMGEEQMPVAAMTIIKQKALEKMAEKKITLGTVSPLTGSLNTEKIGDNEFFCLDTGTKYSVHTKLVEAKGKKYVFAEWRWNAKPTRLNDNCPSCRRAKKAFVNNLKKMNVDEKQFDNMSIKERSGIVLAMNKKGLIKSATKNGSVLNDFKKFFSYPGKKFPIESCREKLARRYGENALALSGPCEGKSLADCICNMLKGANIYGEGLAIKLAQVYSERDPSHECIEDRIREGFSIERSVFACAQIKAKYAQAVEMLADEIGQDEEYGHGQDMPGDIIEIMDETPDIGDPFAEDMEGEEGTVTIELPLEVIDQFEQALDIARGENPEEEEHHEDIPDGDALVEIPGEAADAIEGATEEALDMANAVEDAINEEDSTEESESESESESEEILDEVPEGEGVEDISEEMVEDNEEPEEIKSMDEDMNIESMDEGISMGDAGMTSMSKDEGDESCESCDEDMHDDNYDRMEEAQRFKSHKISGTRDVGLDVSGIMKVLGLNKSAADSDIKITPAQDDKDLGKITDKGKSTMGHEDKLDLSGPDISTGGSKSEMGNEKNTECLNTEETLPTVPHGGAEMGHEKEQGYEAEKQDEATGGEKGQGNNRSASTKNQQNSLADRILKSSDTKLEEKRPVSKDEDIKPISNNKDHSHAPEGSKRTPFSDSDEKEIKDVPVRGDESHMGHEDDQGDVPTSPDHHPEIPEGGGRNEKFDKQERFAPEKQTRDKGTVIANVDDEKTKQRQLSAYSLAGRMLKASLIEDNELMSKIDELMKYEISQHKDLEKSLFGNKFAKKGLVTAPRGNQQPLIIPESSNVRNAQGELSNKIRGLFTLDQYNRVAEDGDNAELRSILRR